MSSQDERARREQSLDEIIQAYEAAETQATANEHEWLARYPEFAVELKEFFDDRRWAHGRLGSASGLEGVKSFGHYQILEEIGRGGMGVVYKAQQKGLERIVAVKTILAGLIATDLDVHRFRREARCAARLRHPNIVTVYEVGEHEGLHYFSMEYIEGRSLSDLLDKGPLPSVQAARYLKPIADAVHYAHMQNVLHRDLKPSNILIDASDQPRITDFGLAKLAQQEDSRQTVSGTILGTPSYMSPEQADGRLADMNERSDVYSLGAILYETITGKPPFHGKTLQQTLGQALNVPALPPRFLNPSVPVELESICLKCLEKEPGKRYASARELAQDCQRFLDGELVLARPASNWGSRLRRYSAMARLETTVADVGLWVGLILALFIGLGPRIGLALAPGRPELNTMAGITALMAVWWVTEAIPSAATALLPLILLPLLGIVPLADLSKLYMHDIIILALGGFLISTALEESGLVRRVALRMVALTGDNPRRIVLGFMIATGGVALWLPSTAAAIIMLPVGLSVLAEIEETTEPSTRVKNLATALMLGIAYAATIGGSATPVGTLATPSFLASYGATLKITPLGWMAVGIPFSLAMGAVCWILLTYGLFPLGTESLLGSKTGVLGRLATLGPMSAFERRMLVVALVTPLLWIFSEPIAGWGWAPLLGLPGRGANAIAAMAMAVVCFLIPSGGPARRRLLEWDATARVPWGVLFLFGGGLALSAGIRSTGLDSYSANVLASFLRDLPSDTGKMLGTTTFVAGIAQMMGSKLATAEMTSPILLQVAKQLSMEPRLLMVSGILGAYCSFLLPASTPPNAVVYGSGKVAVRDMVKAGFWLILAGIVLAVALVSLLAA